MIKISYFFIFLSLTFFTGCKFQDKTDREEVDQRDISLLLNKRYQKLLEYKTDSTAIPRSMTVPTGEIKTTTSKSWTSGFFPGTLWQLNELTKKEEFKEQAAKWNAFIEKEKFNKSTHDIGFMIMGSFGKGLKVKKNKKYEDIIIKSAHSLSTRFNKNVGSLRSWDFNGDGWEFPVIIDNMMNLELLFEATKLTQDSSYHKIAVEHTNTTLKNHFRKDNSAYHVVIYDTISGAVKDKITHQGFNDESAWARGQAWAVYGFTMAYRYTQDTAYLEQAKAMANFFLEHENLPADGIPYWDFDDPDIPDAPKDVSAATIMASALVELYSFTKNKGYKNYTHKVLESLKSREYILPEDVEGPFILKHSTGHWPNNDEIDQPIVYADYYFLEALIRTSFLSPQTRNGKSSEKDDNRLKLLFDTDANNELDDQHALAYLFF